jgi:hypothetical protein
LISDSFNSSIWIISDIRSVYDYQILSKMMKDNRYSSFLFFNKDINHQKISRKLWG